MELRDFVLFAHGAFDNGISGRTALQKIVYFLSVIMDEDAGYNPHYYGPYSSNVAEANSELKELNYLNETATFYGYNEKGFEMARYDYSLTDDGLQLLARKQKQYGKEWHRVSGIAEKIKSAGTMDYMELAMAAKAFMILKQTDSKASRERIKANAKQLSWSIDDQSLDKALSFLEKIELVKWH